MRVGDGFDDCRAESSQVLTFGCDVDIDYTLDLIVIDLSGGLQIGEFDYRIQRGGMRKVGGGSGIPVRSARVLMEPLPCSGNWTLRK